jgi:hypothetical protein
LPKKLAAAAEKISRQAGKRTRRGKLASPAVEQKSSSVG